MKPYECQIPCLKSISEGNAHMGPQSLRKRLSVALRRQLSPSTKQLIKRHSNRLIDWLHVAAGGSATSPRLPTSSKTAGFKAGDLARVRSREEIEATLDHWGQLKGCSFMPEMWPYCDTVKRVLKPMDRFFDERDYNLKRTRGIVLLEGTMCQGTALFGRCDRSCFFFWREEWLEKVADSEAE